MIKCKIDKIIDRSEYNITELCKYVGITRAAYYNILSSSADPKVSTASMILNFMNKNCPDHWPYTLSDFWEIVEEPEKKNDQIPGQLEISELDLLTTDQIAEEINKRTGLIFRKEKTDTYFVKLKKLTLTFSIGPFSKLKEKEDTFILCGSHWNAEDTLKTCYTISDAVEYFCDKLKEYSNKKKAT